MTGHIIFPRHQSASGSAAKGRDKTLISGRVGREVMDGSVFHGRKVSPTNVLLYKRTVWSVRLRSAYLKIKAMSPG